MALARPPQEVFLRDVCTALDDPLVRPRCMLGNAACTEDRTCPAHEFCVNYRGKLAEFLATTSIADIASFEARRRWRSATGKDTD